MSAVDMRTRFIADALSGRYKSHAELCRRHNISRRTGYKWLQRYAELKWPGLLDRSHRPHACPHETPDEVVEALLELRRRHPTWGGQEAARRPRDAPPALGAADPQHRPRSAPAQRPGESQATPAALRPPRPRAEHSRPAQRALDGRLQGSLPHAERPVLLPPDRGRSLQPLCSAATRCILPVRATPCASSGVSSRSTACPSASGPTTGRPSPPIPSGGFPASPPGGSASVSAGS